MFYYPIGATRWKKHTKGDPRGHKAASGWISSAHYSRLHPTTGAILKDHVWWIKEEFVGVTPKVSNERIK